MTQAAPGQLPLLVAGRLTGAAEHPNEGVRAGDDHVEHAPSEKGQQRVRDRTAHFGQKARVTSASDAHERKCAAPQMSSQPSMKSVAL